MLRAKVAKRLFSLKRVIRLESKVQVLRRQQKHKAGIIAARQNEQFTRLQEALSMDEDEPPDAKQSAQKLGTKTLNEKMTFLSGHKQTKHNRSRFLPLFKQGSVLINHYGLKTAFDYEEFPYLNFPGKINVIHSESEEKVFASVLQNLKIIGIDTECRPQFESNKANNPEQKLVNALEKGGERVLLRVENLDQQIPKVQEKALRLLKRTPQLTRDALRALCRGIYIIFREPQTVALYWGKLKEKVKKELHHYWLGTKLLCADTTTSTRIIRRVLHGNAISRRERKQLQRTVADLLRLVPFAFFVVVPFMELLLPVALKMFPNMLPSTFKDSYQREEDMKRQLQLRISLAEFLQETVKEVMQDTRDTEGVSEEQKASASEVMNFVARAQGGQPVTAEETLKVAKMFNDELMLDNISRPQLVAMCRYMGVQHYGNDNLLRFQLRNRLRQLKKDDQDIIWEGLDSLNREELQQACMERGMRATGLTKAGYIRQMKQWLDLSINKNVPASLLIMSRALNITVLDNPEAALATSMSSMDEEVVTEVALAASSENESHKLTKLKLDSIRYQNEMIADEEKYRTEVKKKADEEASAAEAVAEEATATIQDIMKESESSPLPSRIPALASAGMLLDGTMDDLAKKQAEQAEISIAEEAATSKETPSTSAKSVEKIISLEALSALESLAFKSLVEKERQAVDQMKQNKSEMDVESLLAAGRIGARFRENKTAGRMMKKLEAMLSTLEVELDKVDRDVGDRLNILDRDSDGVLSAEELKHAVMTILRKSNREEDVEWLVAQIDEDQDGRISLEKLVEWISKSREVLEATGQISLESADGAEAQESNPPISAAKRTKSRKSSI
ncbi:hypothetical protein ABG067_000691 [Albugo candida]